MAYRGNAFIHTLAGLLMLSSMAVFAETTAEVGKAKFIAYGCYQCHGYQGQGAVTGPRLAPNPLPFAAFEVFVRFPREVMPAYPPDSLSAADLKRIHVYLSSIPQPPTVGDIPLLSRRVGELGAE